LFAKATVKAEENGKVIQSVEYACLSGQDSLSKGPCGFSF
jgi:hypothetical protein